MPLKPVHAAIASITLLGSIWFAAPDAASADAIPIPGFTPPQQIPLVAPHAADTTVAAAVPAAAPPQAPPAAAAAPELVGSSPAVRMHQELALVDLINGSRAAIGSQELTIEQRLMDVARWRAQDMNDRHYSGHQIPAGACYQGTCWDHDIYIWDVLSSVGIGGVVGENMWLGGDLGDQMAETSNTVFLNHEGHREATLDPSWRYVGTGMAYCTWANGVHVVEVFAQFNS